MNKEEIIEMIIDESDTLEIIEKTEEYIKLYDILTDGYRYFFFNNGIEDIKERLYVSPKLINMININTLVEFIKNEIDINALICVKKCYFMYDIDDYEVLVKDTDDEYGYDVIRDNVLGVNWFDEAIIVIDTKHIIDACREEEKEDLKCGLFSHYNEDFYRGLVETIIHEYRHAVFGFNVFALEDEYPESEEIEERVEEYCREKFDNMKYYNIIISPEE